MRDDYVAICVDVYPPGERYDPSVPAHAVDFPAASPEELAVAWPRQWQPGQELRIRFLDGDPDIHRRVQNHAVSWLAYANLTFLFGNHGAAEIRVSFRGSGFWSTVGTDALRIGRSEPTMQLGGLRADSDDTIVQSAVLHEFGHALGCIHEQASPMAAIPWDVPKVYEFYRRSQGWDDETTHHNVLMRYGVEETRFSAFDPLSIMQYPVPSQLTTNGYEIGWNIDLSDGDKVFIARMYPA